MKGTLENTIEAKRRLRGPNLLNIETVGLTESHEDRRGFKRARYDREASYAPGAKAAHQRVKCGSVGQTRLRSETVGPLSTSMDSLWPALMVTRVFIESTPTAFSC
jgi:hypothetical protein